MKKLLIILIAVFQISHFAQNAEFVPGELIIQLNSNLTPDGLISLNKDVDLTPVKVLSERMNIWLFKFDSVKIDAKEILARVSESADVKLAQYNHFIKRRTAADENNFFAPSIDKNTYPNDPQFDEQWSLNNVGQTGGTADADIDAVEAWDLSFGGITADGDEVVIAVVDGGFDLNHEDINFMKNENEIPNNGIDDDGNGYIDDYDGWNAYNSSGTIPIDDHGTHVSGIAGAVGNNFTGVVGVNPDVKIMPVAGSSGVESVVVEAYGYALEMRAEYNESGGEKGAFVVSTNASFGVDYGNPADYPIWCGIYDSLGMQGILNCAATANLNIDIDVQGDVPTACGSDYMISVTNTNQYDNKNSSAAYGASTIDLGAPGTEILNCLPNSQYGYKTGTSMATPHAAGAIALMAAASSPEIIAEYKANPADGALFYRDKLFDAVDPIPALEGITVTGGRLNLFKAVLSVAVSPDDTPPTPITDLQITEITSNSVKLIWTAPSDSTINGVIGYIIKKSLSPINSDFDFDNAETIAFPDTPSDPGETEMISIDSLEFSTNYYFAVKSFDYWGNVSERSNVVSAAAWGAPEISVAPDSIYYEVNVKEIQDSILISNISANPSTLEYSVALTNNTFPDNSIRVKVVQKNKRDSVTDKFSKQGINHGGSLKGGGGPDDFGYTWLDSRDADGPQFIWNDISDIGTEITDWQASSSYDPKDEGYSGPIPLGFDFDYYGEAFSDIYVSSNGFITFAPVLINTYTNDPIPSTAEPNGIICPFWDDLSGVSNGTVYYYSEQGRLTIQFSDWGSFSGSSSYTFQIVMKSNNQILFYYSAMTGALDKASIGIESPDGTDGLQTSYNSTYVENNLAVEYQAEPEWITIDNYSGTIYNGNEAVLYLTFLTDGMPIGDYSMDVEIGSNDPQAGIIIVPVTMKINDGTPVELVSFSAEPVDEGIELRWTTATETNNSGFEIERSFSGIDTGSRNWENIAFVEGAGASSEPRNYFFRDEISGKNYSELRYRLKQVDFNGEFSYSEEITAEAASRAENVLFENYPNPFGEAVPSGNASTTIKYFLNSESIVNLTVYNSLGEEVVTLVNKPQSKGVFSVIFNGKNLSSGIYFYKLDVISMKNKSSFSKINKMLLIK